jgi:hypothetical protein
MMRELGSEYRLPCNSKKTKIVLNSLQAGNPDPLN